MNTLHIGKEKGLVPVLRFKEFDKYLDKLKLEDVVVFKSGGTPSKQNPSYWDGDIPWISAASMNGKYYSESKRTLTEEGLKNGSKLSAKGSLLVLVRGSMLYNKIPVGIAKKDVAFNQDLKSLTVNDNSIVDYLYQWFCAKQNLLLNKVVGTGIGAGKLDTDVLKNLKVNIPTLPEQKKIATFLSTIDKKIQQLTRKKALLEAYKKGLMQELFSGDLRFKDEEGKEYPAWEEKLYGDIFSFYSTNSFSRVNLNYESGAVKNIHYGDIHTKFSTLFNIREELVPYVNSEINTAKIKKECYCQEGDLVIADASEDYSDIGKAIELVELNNEKLIAGLHTFLARPNKTKMYIGFSGYLVQAWYIRKQIMTIAQGTKVLSLSTGRLAKLKVNIPCFQEQKKIANYLSSIDTKIETIATQITKTQTFKKGLLQQMFV